MQSTSSTGLALALSDDLAAIRRYLAEGKLSVVSELVPVAEMRIAVLSEWLRDVRLEAGMTAARPIINFVREG